MYTFFAYAETLYWLFSHESVLAISSWHFQAIISSRFLFQLQMEMLVEGFRGHSWQEMTICCQEILLIVQTILCGFIHKAKSVF